MLITWDEPKREANLEKHGLDFAELTDAFFLESTIKPAKHGRFQAIGLLADGSLSVIFATLGTEAISIISMRPASDKERSLFDAQKT
jgi:uncharacterized DUF497 family protein